jgi:hypothetical protein
MLRKLTAVVVFCSAAFTAGTAAQVNIDDVPQLAVAEYVLKRSYTSGLNKDEHWYFWDSSTSGLFLDHYSQASDGSLSFLRRIRLPERHDYQYQPNNGSTTLIEAKITQLLSIQSHLLVHYGKNSLILSESGEVLWDSENATEHLSLLAQALRWYQMPNGQLLLLSRNNATTQLSSWVLTAEGQLQLQQQGPVLTESYTELTWADSVPYVLGRVSDSSYQVRKLSLTTLNTEQQWQVSTGALPAALYSVGAERWLQYHPKDTATEQYGSFSWLNLKQSPYASALPTIRVKSFLGADGQSVSYISDDDQLCLLALQPDAAPSCQQAPNHLGEARQLSNQLLISAKGLFQQNSDQSFSRVVYTRDQQLNYVAMAEANQQLLVPDGLVTVDADGTIRDIEQTLTANTGCETPLADFLSYPKSQMALQDDGYSLVQRFQPQSSNGSTLECAEVHRLIPGLPARLELKSQVLRSENKAIRGYGPGHEAIFVDTNTPLTTYRWQKATAVFNELMNGDKALQANTAELMDDLWLLRKNSDESGQQLYSLATNSADVKAQAFPFYSYAIAASTQYAYSVSGSVLTVLQNTANEWKVVQQLELDSTLQNPESVRISGKLLTVIYAPQSYLTAPAHYTALFFSLDNPAAPQLNYKWPMPGGAQFSDYGLLQSSRGLFVQTPVNGDLLRLDGVAQSYQVPAELLIQVTESEQLLWKHQPTPAIGLHVIVQPKIGKVRVKPDGVYLTLTSLEKVTDKVVFNSIDQAGNTTEHVLTLTRAITSVPSLAEDVFELTEDSQLTKQLISKNSEGWSLSLHQQSAHGNASLTGTTLSFTPALNFYGQDKIVLRYSFASTYQDVPVWLNVQPVNDKPVIAAINPLTVEVLKTLEGQLNVTDVEGDSVSYQVTGLNNLSLKGTATIDSKGKFSYLAPATATSETLLFKVTDAAGAVSELTVQVVVNAAPVSGGGNAEVPDTAKESSGGALHPLMLLLLMLICCGLAKRRTFSD